MAITKILQSAIDCLEKGDTQSAIATLKDLNKSISNGTEFRVKVGKNSYSNDWICSSKHCGSKFFGDGLYLLIERLSDGKDIIVTLCPECMKDGDLREKKVQFGDGNIIDMGLA